MREVERHHIHAGERNSELREGRTVRPVPEPDEQRVRIEPDRVSAFDARRVGDLRGDRDAGFLERGADRGGLGSTNLLPGPEKHGAVRTDQDGVVDVHRVRVAGVVPGDDDIGARILEQRTEGLVLRRRRGEVGLRPPAACTPPLDILGQERTHENTLERSGHGCGAETGHVETLHRTPW